MLSEPQIGFSSWMIIGLYNDVNNVEVVDCVVWLWPSLAKKLFRQQLWQRRPQIILVAALANIVFDRKVG